jgi:hypothetical protein
MATIKGKWVFKDTMLVTESFREGIPFYATVKENIVECNTIIAWPDYSTTNPIVVRFGSTSGTYDFYTNSAYNINISRIVDFGTTEQTVTDTFLTWLTANATPEAEPIPTDVVTIEYNGAVIASLKAGQSATLPCKDLPMLTDVVVSVPDELGGSVEEWDGSIEVV